MDVTFVKSGFNYTIIVATCMQADGESSLSYATVTVRPARSLVLES